MEKHQQGAMPQLSLAGPQHQHCPWCVQVLEMPLEVWDWPPNGGAGQSQQEGADSRAQVDACLEN